MSLIKDISFVKGESTAIYRFGTASYPDLSVGWEATATIREKNIDGVVKLTKDLPLTEDNSKFVFQLIPSESDTLIVGKYFLSIEIKNVSLNYSKEVVQCPLTVGKTGI